MQFFSSCPGIDDPGISKKVGNRCYKQSKIFRAVCWRVLKSRRANVMGVAEGVSNKCSMLDPNDAKTFNSFGKKNITVE